jgi:hypothetical protein
MPSVAEVKRTSISMSSWDERSREVHVTPLSELDMTKQGPPTRPTAKRWLSSSRCILQIPDGLGPVTVVTGVHVAPRSEVS